MGYGGCPHSWTGFSKQAFVGLWDFFKLSVASGVKLSLENFYYRVLIIISGNMNNAEVALDALSIWLDLLCFGFMWEIFRGLLMIKPLKPYLVSKVRLWKPSLFMTKTVVDQGVWGL
ncbi:protein DETOXIFICATION 27-like [Camellia sinensis]|uniref:protein DETOXIFICATION 27-like n=1 Tax=Camellia sinensis TaxID=4442 RepID=UPI00103672E6|nr:protein DETOXIFICATION 27-like [Camellia sinensis]